MKVYRYPSRSEWPRLSTRPSMLHQNIEPMVKKIFDDVKRNGDEAAKLYTKKFDRVEFENFELSSASQDRLVEQVPVELKKAISRAYKNIKKFHKSQVPEKSINYITTSKGIVCWQETRPIESVGLYIPGGSAPLFSSVLMLGVPAQLAGCKRVVLCTPQNLDGSVSPAIVYAARLCGINELFTIGGTQAIAAMCLGTKSIPKVDKIFGPGNQYVTAAKMYALNFGVAIDMPAGPSEVMVIGDKAANPIYVAADLLSQAEHGPDSQFALVSTSSKLISDVNDEINRQLAKLPRKAIANQAINNSFAILVRSLGQAIDFGNYFAPEHLILNVINPESLLSQVLNVGSVFVGPNSPESAGDYASGTNHTLPTNGWAKSYGAVSARDFGKQVTFQKISKSGLTNLAETIITMAKAEGLQAHAGAVEVRLSSNSPQL